METSGKIERALARLADRFGDGVRLCGGPGGWQVVTERVIPTVAVGGEGDFVEYLQFDQVTLAEAGSLSRAVASALAAPVPDPADLEFADEDGGDWDAECDDEDDYEPYGGVVVPAVSATIACGCSDTVSCRACSGTGWVPDELVVSVLVGRQARVRFVRPETVTLEVDAHTGWWIIRPLAFLLDSALDGLEVERDRWVPVAGDVIGWDEFAAAVDVRRRGGCPPPAAAGRILRAMLGGHEPALEDLDIPPDPYGLGVGIDADGRAASWAVELVPALEVDDALARLAQTCEVEVRPAGMSLGESGWEVLLDGRPVVATWGLADALSVACARNAPVRG